ncbi:MAG: PHP domain-containing protein [Candidatus Aenigmatarchaeota archaeon]
MLVDLHVHTNYSKGTKIFHEGMNTPEQIVRHAKKIGLSAVAITDHDNIEGALSAKRFEKKYGIIIISGEEVSTKNGHILALGINEFIAPGLSVDETLDLIHQQGGIAIASHPFDVARKGLGYLSKKCDAVEAFNAMNIERIGNMKCERFAKNNRLPMVAGSDAHKINMLGFGITKINADSVDEILKKIKKGDTTLICKYVPTKFIVDWTVQRLKMSYGYTIDYMNKNYSWPKKTIGKKLIGLVERSPGNIDYMFNIIGYLCLAIVITYRGVREVLSI